MKPLRYLVIFAACALCAGCRVSKQDVELLERDLRLQEDEIYTLQDCVDTYQKKLESCRSENRALRKELAARGGNVEEMLPPGLPTGPEVELGPGGRLPDAGEPGFPTELDPGQYEEAPPFTPPLISPPGQETYEDVPGARSTRGNSHRVSQISPGDAEGGTALVGHTAPRSANPGQAEALLDRLTTSSDPAERVADPVHDLEVVDVTLNKMLTGGMNRDQRDGDEGLLVVIEPRNPKQQIVQAFGQISIVVLDPALTGEAARIARWDITSQELEHRFRSRQFGRGFQLELPWPGDPPQHSDLHLFVRFVGDDGRKLIVDRELKINPPGGAADGGWLPATRSGVAMQDDGPEMLISSESQAEQIATNSAEVEPVPAPRTATLSTRPIGESAPPNSQSTPPRSPSAPRVAQVPDEVSASPASKRRPQWSPYR